MKLFRWFGVLSIVAMLLAACGQAQLTADEIMKRVQEARANTKDAHATMEVVMSGTQMTGRFLVETWLAKSDQLDPSGQPIAKTRMKILEAERAEMVGSEIINDGTTLWVYDPKENRVIRGDLAELSSGAIGAADPTAQLTRIQDMLQQILDNSNVEILAENEPVAERKAWKLKLTPKPETAEQMGLTSAVETTMWVDQERNIPLKGIVNAADIGRLEGTVQTIELDKGVDPTIFAFTPPAGATVLDAAEMARNARPEATTLEEAAKSASFKVYTPQPLPEGVKLDEVQATRFGGESVIQNYSGTISFSLVQTTGQRGFGQNDTPFGAKTETLTVRGQEATLITGTAEQQGTLLRWQENGVSIIIAGTLNRDQALQVAESLK